MPVVEKTHGGRVYFRGIDERVSVGDQLDVADEFAAYLLENRTDFRVVDEPDDEYSGTNDASGDDGAAELDGFDASAFVDRTPIEDVVEDIHAGEADDHLDAVAEAADRVGVEDAVGERRAELEAKED